MKFKFKIGDRVRHRYYTTHPYIGTIQTVIYYKSPKRAKRACSYNVLWNDPKVPYWAICSAQDLKPAPNGLDRVLAEL